jgi:DNA-directed RNA polymerase specialized sigma24 family protein
VADRDTAADRHELALAFGRRLLEHRWPQPLVVASAPPSNAAVALLQQRDWVRLEDAYEQLDRDEQIPLDLSYGLRPGDGPRRALAEVAEALGVREATAAAAVRRAVTRLDGWL